MPKLLIPFAERMSRIAELTVGFDHASVLLPEGRTVPLDPDRPRIAGVLDRRVLEAGEALVVEDASTLDPQPVELATSSRPAGTGDADGDPLGAYVGIPVSHENHVVAVLSVCDSLPRTVSRRDLGVLIELGALLSIELSRVLSSQPEVDPVALDLARGLARGEVIAWYQPIVDMVSEAVVGVESLARWRRAPGVVELPAAFVPVAEQSNLIIDLDMAVLRRAAVDLATWQRTRPDFFATVNLSARHLDRDGWLDELTDVVRAAGVDPSTMILELTETTAPTDERSGRRVVDLMREIGFHVWFDDFGSGWSALSDLSHFPVDGIKIDRSYALQLGTRTGEVVIAALTSAAAELGLNVTIEGIETPLQAQQARNLGCHFGQGYLWSRPVPPAAVARWTQAGGGSAAQAT